MRILSWNIRHGGGSRVARIREVIAGHAPDVLVLPEFRNNAAGDSLRDWLRTREHHHQIVPATEQPAHNTVLLSAREKFTPVHFAELGAEARRCIGGRFGPLTILAFYFATMEAKRPVFEFIQGRHVGYRLDHALVSPGLLPRVKDVRYSHAERGPGMSDHSGLLLELAE